MAETNTYKNVIKPSSALNLYVNLYCMKCEGKTKSNSITEATKSWLALSNEEKEIFYRKYNEYCENVRKSYANKLKNIEPFLKQKKNREKNLQNNVNCDINSSIQDRETQSPASSIHTLLLESQDDLCSNADQMKSDNDHQETLCLDNSQRDIDEDSKQVMNIPMRLPEPIEPTIRTAKDLFEIVNTLHEGITSWTSLSVLQKRRYQTAVLALKKDYIVKYKNYLESLSSEELFEHYCSKTSECT